MTYLGPVMIDIEGVELTDEDKNILAHPLVGGVILFTRNFDSVKQVSELINKIKALRSPELLVCIDHEGGRVQRFKDPFTHIPALNNLGIQYNKNPDKAKHHAEIFGWLTSVELLTFNIDFSFTPVLDVDYGLSGVIGDRAFHQQPEVIAELAGHYIKGMHRAGMKSTGKHFPGHGGVKADSHTDIPIDDRSLEEIQKNDMLPFKKLCPESLDGIMTAHVIYEKVINESAGFSELWLMDILRNQLKFDGVIFSDDLDMKGASVVSQHYSERAQRALKAGCDMVLVCNNREAAKQVLENLNYKVTDTTSQQLLRMRGTLKNNINVNNKSIKNKDVMNESISDLWQALTHSKEWIDAVNIIKQYQ